jgi:hypothetical protein
MKEKTKGLLLQEMASGGAVSHQSLKSLSSLGARPSFFTIPATTAISNRFLKVSAFSSVSNLSTKRNKQRVSA